MTAHAAASISARYKWLALSNTTTAVLLATIDSSIVLIAMPNIFRGIQLNPLAPHSFVYLLWMILGFQIVSSVLVVSFGRLGDMFGRVRMYNLGFVISPRARCCWHWTRSKGKPAPVAHRRAHSSGGWLRVPGGHSSWPS